VKWSISGSQSLHAAVTKYLRLCANKGNLFPAVLEAAESKTMAPGDSECGEGLLSPRSVALAVPSHGGRGGRTELTSCSTFLTAYILSVRADSRGLITSKSPSC
jgi:hypothetical protein